MIAMIHTAIANVIIGVLGLVMALVMRHKALKQKKPEIRQESKRDIWLIQRIFRYLYRLLFG